MSQERRVFVNVSSLSKRPEDGALPFLCPLDDEASHHTRDVLRLRAGDAVTAIDTASRQRYGATITDLWPVVVLRLERELPHPARASRVKTLIFALCKGERNDVVCQKGCELGADRILFWQAARSIVRIESPRDRDKKLERWSKIALAAAQQSNRSDVPSVGLALSTEELLAELRGGSATGDALLVCSLESDAREFRHISPPSGGVHLAIGPEGDFTPAEYAALKELGFLPVSLGPRVLRAETAAIAAIAAVNAVWGFEN
ncbi:MAG: hypothetical protein RL417_859 [Pseudomonadota bacterium]